MAAQDSFSMYGLRTPDNPHQSGMHQSEMDQMDQMDQGMDAFMVFSFPLFYGIPDWANNEGRIGLYESSRKYTAAAAAAVSIRPIHRNNTIRPTAAGITTVAAGFITAV